MRNRMGEGTSRRPEVIAEWRARLARYAACGTTMTEFAAKEGVKVRQVSWWIHELPRMDRGLPARNSGRRKKEQAAPVAFAEVVAVGARRESPEDRLELVVRGRVAIRIPREFDAETLRRVMAALEVT